MGLQFPGQMGCSVFFVTTTFADWRPFGTIPGMYEFLADSLNHYAQSYYAGILGYVLMPTHLHLIVMSNGSTLGSFMRDFKKFTAQNSIRTNKIKQSNVWMSRYDRVAIISKKVLIVKLEYIHNNPVKAGLVIRPEDWPWSSASDYLAGTNGLVNVDKEW